jgi:two-component system cell cycle sensor histidine kinase/response regulator CckA
MNCGVKTILVLEDEPLVMKLMRQVLRRYDVLSATTAEQALHVFAGGSQVDLLVTDVRLPSLSGIQVAIHLRSQFPAFPVVLMSGYLADGWRDVDTLDLERLGPESVVLLQKPFETQALLNAVYDLIGKPHAEIASTA